MTIINSRPLASDLLILFSTVFLLSGTGNILPMANLDNHSKICCDFSRYLCTGLKSSIDEKNLVGNKRIKHFCSHWMFPIPYKKNYFFQYYAQFDLQGSENHKDLYDSLKKWREERKMKPDVSLTISVGDPLGGPDDTQNFLADPFRVSFGPRPILFSFLLDFS